MNITDVKPVSEKSFDEAKGQVIGDYQIVLESEWIEELRSKFDVKINEEVLEKVNEQISN